MTDLERMARAARDASRVCYETHVTDPLSGGAAETVVRAVLSELLKPSEGMLDACDDPFHAEFQKQTRDGVTALASGPFSRIILTAAINAILE